MDTLINFIAPYEHILWLMTLLSLMSFIASLVFVPLAIKRLPRDYFSNSDSWHKAHRHTSLPWRLIRNLLACVFIVFGVVMLVTPGQGLLTILVGVLLADIPGKHGIECALARRPGVFSALNWLRRRQGAEPFEAITG